jgi:hypothetical protein
MQIMLQIFTEGRVEGVAYPISGVVGGVVNVSTFPDRIDDRTS